EVKIDELIKPLIMKYRVHFIEQNTKIHYQSVDDNVLTDAQWASILIEQLLNNALKYARGKDIWINFNSETKQLYIKDNGIGISQADLPKIFDKGYSGYNGSLNESSSGIGLFIVKHISQHLNLNVEVESKLNSGTQFTIDFPRE
ncbi:ATP-binding protein, partial [Staphylococcus sp. E463]